MKQIVPFAHLLGVDTLNLTLMRNNPPSGIDELVAQNPEYHIPPSGKVDSNHCTLNELKSLRVKCIRSSTPNVRCCVFSQKDIEAASEASFLSLS